MGLDVMATPDPTHAGLADPLRYRHGPATPMRISFGLGLQSGVNHSLDSSCIVTGFPAPTWSNLPKCLDPPPRKRSRQRRTVLRFTPVSVAIATSVSPAA